MAECAICSTICDADDFCTGCGHYVCAGCEADDPPWGAHDLDAHRRSEPDEEA